MTPKQTSLPAGFLLCNTHSYVIQRLGWDKDTLHLRLKSLNRQVFTL